MALHVRCGKFSEFCEKFAISAFLICLLIFSADFPVTHTELSKYVCTYHIFSVLYLQFVCPNFQVNGRVCVCVCVCGC